MPPDTGTPWTTEKEKAFLHKLGNHRPPTKRPPNWPTRIDLLKMYLQTMSKRKHWGPIDPESINRYIQIELKKVGDR